MEPETSSIVIPCQLADVWEVVGDFGNTGWMGTQTATVDGSSSEAGCKRYFSDGNFDTLTAYDAPSTSYTYCRSTVDDSTVTVSVTGGEEGECTVKITSTADSQEDLDSWLQSLKRGLTEPVKTYDDPVLGLSSQKIAELANPTISLKALPFRHYMDQTMTPLLLQGMAELVKLRPENPAEWLAIYLFQNNPHKHPYRDR